MSHITVLLSEAVDALVLRPNDIVVDATFGGGGHAREITSRLDKQGCYIGIDADITALENTYLKDVSPQVHLVHDNFANIANIVCSLHINSVDAILADLGWRLEQFTDGGKGFSFLNDEPLLMTYGDPAQYDFSARDIVNEWDESVIADILFGYAEERYARRIAKAIFDARKQAPINTSRQLAEVVVSALPPVVRHGRIHPATKTFQALRIAVNNELQVLERFINDGFSLLKPGGRMAIISFHSIEDRVVKHLFRDIKDRGLATLLTKKPITPSLTELKQNPRARSAKLRIITKIDEQFD